ncbi:MAG: hypothetical protein ACTS73_00005 [Arsenophonus sp. NEOnobi-MAG3]
MISNEKSTLEISVKSDITCNPLYELIRNSTKHLIATAVLRLS